MYQLSVFLIFILVSSAAFAGEIYNCTVNGQTIFTDTPCGPNSKPINIEIQSHSDGLRPGEQRMLDRAFREDQQRYLEKKRAEERYTRNHTTHSSRLRLRELEMRRKEVMGHINRGKVSWGEGKVLKGELQSIDREIAQIKRPKY